MGHAPCNNASAAKVAERSSDKPRRVKKEKCDCSVSSVLGGTERRAFGHCREGCSVRKEKWAITYDVL